MHKKATAYVAVLAMSAFLVIGFVGPASAVANTNACRNSAVSTNWDQVNTDITATASRATVNAGNSVTLSNLSLTMSIPGAIFVAGYNLGLLTVGLNTIPADIHMVIDGSNTVELSQSTNTVASSVQTTISDPDGTPGSGDETGTDATATVNFNNQTWTAGVSGTINFVEHPDTALNGVSGGGIIAVAHLGGGALNVQFHCTSGTVAGSNPGVPTFTTPPTLASSTIGDLTPVANAGPDQTVPGGALVTLDGSASADSDGDALTYAWSQTGGTNTVTLSSVSAVKPTFTAPTASDTLTFQLQTCDAASNCTTDSVTINVIGTVIDASMNVIISGPVRTAAGDKTLIAKVTNNGTGSQMVCGTDVSWAIMVNGTLTTGTVSPNTACKTLSPGASVRLKFKWTFGTGEVSAGLAIDFTATVSVTGDVTTADDSDTETRIAK